MISDSAGVWILKYRLVGKSALQFYSGYADYESNYPQADYGQTVVGSRFLYRW